MKRDIADFDMFSFDNRLRLQKFTYLLQHSTGINLDYDFNWYHYGPYSKQLTQDGFNVNCSEIPKLKFGNEQMENRFNEFLTFIEGKDNFWIEVVASIHYLKKLGCDDEKIITIIKQKHKEFELKETEIREIFSQLKSGGKI